ncbi:MAG: DUF4293 domain-containing protein [Flavobacteriales bacterium]
MIQRIQTLYLILAAVALSFIFLAPIASFTGTDGVVYTLNIKDLLGSDGSVQQAASRISILILAPITVLSIGFMILQFKNRQKQMAIGRLIYLMLAALITLAWFFIEANKFETQISGYGLGYFAPVAALPFIFLANRSIKKDEELVKSLDRLR